MDIGFIGLGDMGRPMSLNLIKAGHRLTVHDIDRDGRGAIELLEAGATWGQTSRETAQGAEIVFTSLPGPQQVEAVALGEDGILVGASKGSVYIDLTTNSPTLMQRVHRIFGEHGIDVLDSPVSQGHRDAKYKGTLTMMVGGDKAVFDRVWPVLDVIGHDHIVYCGESGTGAICKLVNNLVMFTTPAPMIEALTLGVKAGVPVEKLTEVMMQSSGRNPGVDRFRAGMDRPRTYHGEDIVSMYIAQKDVRLATDLARELDVPMDIGNLVEQKLTEAIVRGWGSHSVAARFRLEEERTGVDLRSEAQRKADEEGQSGERA